MTVRRRTFLTGLDARLAFLRLPSSYPQPTPDVEAIETHMSWVFLTRDYAYKLKKPIRHDIFDFRSLDARKHFCDEELRLNRRLAQDVYLAVVPLTIDAGSCLHLEADGNPVDWLVKMVRLPAERMLDRMVRDGTATPHDIRRIARRLADFYRNEPAIILEARSCLAVFLHEVARNRRELLSAEYGLPAARVRRICDAHRAFLRSCPQLIEERVRGLRMVEGHGDLRPEHVSIGKKIAIIDCMEAERRLRIVDPADETGFLALELERSGAPDLAALLLQAYTKETGDAPAAPLMAFYQSFRACVRARLAIRHLDDGRFRASDKWRARALDYLDLAELHLPSTNSLIEPPS